MAPQRWNCEGSALASEAFINWQILCTGMRSTELRKGQKSRGNKTHPSHPAPFPTHNPPSLHRTILQHHLKKESIRIALSDATTLHRILHLLQYAIFLVLAQALQFHNLLNRLDHLVFLLLHYVTDESLAMVAAGAPGARIHSADEGVDCCGEGVDQGRGGVVVGGTQCYMSLRLFYGGQAQVLEAASLTHPILSQITGGVFVKKSDLVSLNIEGKHVRSIITRTPVQQRAKDASCLSPVDIGVERARARQVRLPKMVSQMAGYGRQLLAREGHVGFACRRWRRMIHWRACDYGSKEFVRFMSSREAATRVVIAYRLVKHAGG
ncbi:hypothetical protein K458DRAFT_409390 [Lentithecium fluviatile CBS 122367]|uniref:Uncharacterized protein n=1 Tax=Lentithecium fluviatile CBS 122367 TaxID=1168545 RepID=A0A6G1II56_9PLEO|nr:hypothetical protein K458DRAFT_409390 [Lentithecium fluviatile CBS 122367]